MTEIVVKIGTWFLDAYLTLYLDISFYQIIMHKKTLALFKQTRVNIIYKKLFC